MYFLSNILNIGSIIEIKKRKGGETVVHELQRVIARCECEFQYINLDDELDPVAKEYTPKTPTVLLFVKVRLVNGWKYTHPRWKQTFKTN